MSLAFIIRIFHN